jgi:hypothetical protein
VDDAIRVAPPARVGGVPAPSNDWFPFNVLGQLTIVDPPEHGTATVDAGSRVAYKVTEEFAGTDEIGYRVCTPAGKCDEATIVVTRPPPAPATVRDEYVMKPGETADLDVLANDSAPFSAIDPSSLRLYFQNTPVQSMPIQGALVSAIAGKLRVQLPAGDYEASQAADYWICNVLGRCSVGNVVVHVRRAGGGGTPPGGGDTPPGGGDTPPTGGDTPPVPGPGTASPAGTRTTLIVRRRGSRLLLRGKVGGPAAKVEIQRKQGRRWRRVRTVKVRSGRWTAKVAPLRRGTLLRARALPRGPWTVARVR